MDAATVTLIAVTLDPEGRRIRLTEGAWRHIKSEHPDMTRYLRDIMAAVREPDRRVVGPTAGEEWFYRSEAGPSAWIRVVVHYEHERGLIVTAFPRRSFP